MARSLPCSRRHASSGLVGLAAAALLLGSTAPAAAQDTPAPPKDFTQDACPPETTPEAGFPDLASATSPAAVSCIAAYGIARGFGDGTFGPGEPVLRRQMATFLYRLGLYAGARFDVAPAPFGDADLVAGEQATAVAALANAGVTRGRANGEGDFVFAPNEVVSRGQMAAFLDRLQQFLQSEQLGLGLDFAGDAAPGDYFVDDAPPFEQAIDAAAFAGITAGTSADRYSPAAPVTRQQMALFLARMLEHEQQVLRPYDGLVAPLVPAGPFPVQPAAASQADVDEEVDVVFTTPELDGYRVQVFDGHTVQQVGELLFFDGDGDARADDGSPSARITAVNTAPVAPTSGPVPVAAAPLPDGSHEVSVTVTAPRDEPVVVALYGGDETSPRIDLARPGEGRYQVAPTSPDEVVAVSGPISFAAPPAGAGDVAGSVTALRLVPDQLVIDPDAVPGNDEVRVGFDDGDTLLLDGDPVDVDVLETEVVRALLNGTAMEVSAVDYDPQPGQANTIEVVREAPVAPAEAGSERAQPQDWLRDLD